MKKILFLATLLCGVTLYVCAEGEAARPQPTRLERADNPKAKHGTFDRNNVGKSREGGGRRSVAVQKDMAGTIKALRQNRVTRRDRPDLSGMQIAKTEITRQKGQEAARSI
ncbi:hypothetical protein COB28_01335 [Candidatus Dependentiae bacterium]|nr:MAG: hypothetical protein COB28_01335 [Candidatus Dependentiae bacterium]